LRRPVVQRWLLFERSDVPALGRQLLHVEPVLLRPVVSLRLLRHGAHLRAWRRCVRGRDAAVLREHALLRGNVHQLHAHLSVHLRQFRRLRAEQLGVLRRAGTKHLGHLRAAVREHWRELRRWCDVLHRADLQRLGRLRGPTSVQARGRLLQQPLGVLRERASLWLERDQRVPAMPYAVCAAPGRGVVVGRLLRRAVPE